MIASNFFKRLFDLLSAVLLLGIGGIIGNRADTAFLGLLLYLRDTTVNFWIFVGACVSAMLAAWLAACYYRSEQLAIELIRLDDTLFRLLSTISLSADPSESIKRLIEEFLEGTLALFADGCRIHILRPDVDGDYLTIWHSRGIPPETISRTRFSINRDLSPDQKPGVAGKSYRENKLQVVKTRVTKGRPVANCDDYISFVDGRKRIPYRSFAAIPISNDKKVLGVLCVDSNALDTFDSKSVQDLLRNLADRLAATIIILEEQFTTCA